MRDWPLQPLWGANMAWPHNKAVSCGRVGQIAGWLPDAPTLLSDSGAEVVADLFNNDHSSAAVLPVLLWVWWGEAAIHNRNPSRPKSKRQTAKRTGGREANSPVLSQCLLFTDRPAVGWVLKQRFRWRASRDEREAHLPALCWGLENKYVLFSKKRVGRMLQADEQRDHEKALWPEGVQDVPKLQGTHLYEQGRLQESKHS